MDAEYVGIGEFTIEDLEKWSGACRELGVAKLRLGDIEISMDPRRLLPAIKPIEEPLEENAEERLKRTKLKDVAAEEAKKHRQMMAYWSSGAQTRRIES